MVRRGARSHAINLSVVRTVHFQGGDFLDSFRQARIVFHEGGDFPKLFPSPVVMPAAPLSLN